MDNELVQPGMVRTIVSKLQPKPGSEEYDNAADDKDLGRSNYQQLKESLATNKNKAIKLADRAVETMKKSAEALMMVRILEAKLAEMEANKSFQKEEDRQIRENKKKEKAIQLENAQIRANKRLRSLGGKAVGRVTVSDPDEGLIFDEAVEDFDDDVMDI
jgi:phage-related minor tail protein